MAQPHLPDMPPKHDKKVYLVRFVVLQDLEETSELALEGSNNSEGELSVSSHGRNGRASSADKPDYHVGPRLKIPETQFPASVSIDTLLNAGKLVKPIFSKKAKLNFEHFDIESGKWQNVMNVECEVESEKFSSGAFRDAYHATTVHGDKWVIKTYNQKTKNTISDTVKSTVENHCRKQVQMHAVARHLAKKFERKAPSTFGECFKYNRCYYTMFDGEHATIEEFVPGYFVKYINNNGKCVPVQEDANQNLKDLFSKAETLVHYSYVITDHKLMLLDIQGSDFTLYDPEIATEEIMDKDHHEIYFCCGNCSTVGINAFLSDHICNEYCDMMDLK
ncbi:myosin heavy chain kinase B-like [Oculina patagonica]